MESGEGDQVDGELSEVGVELTGESEAAGDSGEGGGDEMVKVTVGGGGELEGPEADVVEGLVVNAHDLVGGLNDGVGDLGGGMTEKVTIIRSGYSSRILEMRRVPMPDPVPPPREWVTWNPWRQSQPSASLRTTSRTESMSSAPSV